MAVATLAESSELTQGSEGPDVRSIFEGVSLETTDWNQDHANAFEALAAAEELHPIHLADIVDVEVRQYDRYALEGGHLVPTDPRAKGHENDVRFARTLREEGRVDTDQIPRLVHMIGRLSLPGYRLSKSRHSELDALGWKIVVSSC